MSIGDDQGVNPKMFYSSLSRSWDPFLDSVGLKGSIKAKFLPELTFAQSYVKSRLHLIGSWSNDIVQRVAGTLWKS